MCSYHLKNANVCNININRSLFLFRNSKKNEVGKKVFGELFKN